MTRWLLAIAVVALACKRADDRPIFNTGESFKQQMEQRFAAAMEDPAVDKAFDDLLAAIGAHPRVQTGFDELIGSLGNDPELAAAARVLFDAVGDSLAMRALAKESPRATPEQLGALAEQRFNQNLASPTSDRAWMAAWKKLLAQLRPGSKLARIENAVGDRLGEDFGGGIDRTRRWNKRLVELAGGSRPTPERGEQLYFETAWAKGRLEAVIIKVASNPTLRDASGQALGELLALKSMRGELRTALTKILKTREVQDQLVTTLGLLLAPEPKLDELTAAFEKLITSPTIVDAVSKLIDATFRDPEVARIMGTWFDRIIKDPAIRAECVKFWDEW